MNKMTLGLILAIFPVFVMAADGSLAFTPPASDYSVVFLGNIFGVVDGVLHGSGSQMLGQLFGVFNAAVLALGGIIIIYTLMVATLNTAQEGQFLGQKWSSLWVPVRTVFGLGLLIPKASGYCLMQIFVMWLVLQGVGAADKIWEAALSYLNQGGTIVMAQDDPTKTLTGGSKSGLGEGAQTILAGQVCMLGLEKQLQAQRDRYLEQRQNESGPCYGDVSPEMQGICRGSIPSFINTVNAVSVQSAAPEAPSFEVKMPNFDTASPYSRLNGICGEIRWNKFDVGQNRIEGVDYNVASMSRAIALQQMYMDLSFVARVMVNNNPELSGRETDEDTDLYSPVAEQQFGVPLTINRKVCASSRDEDCTIWGQAPGSNTAPLFNGTEFRGALTDYTAIIRPALVLKAQSADRAAAEESREFIREANQRGWIMAGSYFFNVINLSQAAAEAGQDAQDINSGINGSTFDVAQLSAPFEENNTCNSADPYSILCIWLNKDQSAIEPITQLIQGGGDIPTTSPPQKLDSGTIQGFANQGSSTVYGLTANQSIFLTQKQPGQEKIDFSKLQPKINWEKFTPAKPSTCGGPSILGTSLCITKYVVLAITIVVGAYFSALIIILMQLLPVFIELLIVTPLIGITEIFQSGAELIQAPGVNPIVALAKMGTFYINFAGNLLIQILELSITIGLLPFGVGLVILPILFIGMPLVFAWTSIMIGVGIITAYYVPLLPYLIFTFASIGWILAVIEAMVAAPIVALGITHPEGHEAFGKGETAIMILMNVFLRPSMMIIGYIVGISLTFVGVWLLNAGFSNAMDFHVKANVSGTVDTSLGRVEGGYTQWAGLFLQFFTLLIYVSAYVVIVQKSFTLITMLPDKVLRWIGAQGETVGQETAQWGEEIKQKVEKGGEETSRGLGAVGKQAEAYAQKGISKAKEMFNKEGGGVSGEETK